MNPVPAPSRVLYQRFPAGGAFDCIDNGYIAGYRAIGCEVLPWTDTPGRPSLASLVDEFRPTHVVACLHNPDRTTCRWTRDAIDALRNSQVHVSVRMNPPHVAAFFRDAGFDFSQYPEFGVSSFYTRPDGLNGEERRTLESGVINLVRTPIALDAIPECFESVLELGLPILEEPHAADTTRYRRLEPAERPHYAATFVGRCWPFKWSHMGPFIEALHSRFQHRFAVFGAGWPTGVSSGPIDDAGFARTVAASSVCLSLHEPTQTMPRPFAQNERVFKLMTMGACVVSDANPALVRQFTAGREIVLAGTPAQMVNEVARLDEDLGLRRRIADAGRWRILAEHTYAHRARRLLEMAAHPPDPGAISPYRRVAQLWNGAASLADVPDSNALCADPASVRPRSSRSRAAHIHA